MSDSMRNFGRGEDPVDLYKSSTSPVLSTSERKDSSILVVDGKAGMRNSLKLMLSSLNFMNVSEAADPLIAIRKLEERQFSHVIFECDNPKMPGREFLTKIIEIDSRVIAIPTSSTPSVDQVFGLLMTGARGFLVKPFNAAAVDEALVMASKGEPLSEAILHARDRNEALASLVMANLDRLALILKQARQFDTARREVPKRDLIFKRSIHIGMTFAQGGPVALRDAVIAFCLDRSSGPSTRLGRLRSKLKGPKKKKEPMDASGAGDDESHLLDEQDDEGMDEEQSESSQY